MLKALFLDLDETLCDTSSATEQARQLLGQALQEQFGRECNSQGVAHAYVSGLYRQWSDSQRETDSGDTSENDPDGRLALVSSRKARTSLRKVS